MPQILWKYEDEEDFDDQCDLVGDCYGFSVDVVQYGSDTNLWSVSLDNLSIKRDILGRENARAYITDKLSGEPSDMLRMMLKLMKED